MTHYLCKNNRPIMGPMLQRDVVAVIQAQQEQEHLYSNASRYDLYGSGFPRNKKGNQDLERCIAESQQERAQLWLGLLPVFGALGTFLHDKEFCSEPTGVWLTPSPETP